MVIPLYPQGIGSRTPYPVDPRILGCSGSLYKTGVVFAYALNILLYTLNPLSITSSNSYNVSGM